MSRQPESINPNNELVRAHWDNVRNHHAGFSTEEYEDMGFQSADETRKLAEAQAAGIPVTISDPDGSAAKIRRYLDGALVDRPVDEDSPTAGITEQDITIGGVAYRRVKDTKTGTAIDVKVSDGQGSREFGTISQLLGGGGRPVDELPKPDRKK